MSNHSVNRMKNYEAVSFLIPGPGWLEQIKKEMNMKPKKLRKKLTLKKQTITHLGDKQQDEVRGGVSETTCYVDCTQNTCYPLCGSFNSLCWKDTLCGYTCDNAC